MSSSGTEPSEMMAVSLHGIEEVFRMLARDGRPLRMSVVRHGESLRNQEKKGRIYFADAEARERVRGIPDHKIPLTVLGIRQARRTGVALRKRYGVPDYVYHTGYRRTRETKDGLLRAYMPAERRRIHVRSSLFLRERDPGYAYDMTKDEAEAAFPWLREHWKTFGGFFARPPGGESLADVAIRVYLFLNMAFRDRAGKNLVVISHGGTLRCLRFLLERWSYDRALRWPKGQSPANCGVTVYEFDPAVKRLVLRGYNSVYWR